MEERLFNHYQTKGLLVGLSEIQVLKFRYACKKSMLENPNLGFDDLLRACKIYFDMIRDFPDCDLGEIRVTEQI